MVVQFGCLFVEWKMVESKKGDDHDQVKVKTLRQPIVVKGRKRGRRVVRRKGHATKIDMEEVEAKKEGVRKEEAGNRKKGDYVFVGHLNLGEQRKK
jgi:hypothetical protein